jgi:hypothetical protein
VVIVKWINAKEELPTEEGTYLVWNTYHSNGSVMINKFYFDKNGNGLWATWIWDTITHWMPLPEKPETS